MKNAELIARLRLIAGKGMADYFNSGHPNSNAITEAADAIEKLEAEVERLGMALHGYQVAIETAEESLKDRVALAMEVDRLSAAGVSHCGHRPPCVECSKYAAPIPQQPALSVPEGWKLVPIEPTLEMMREGGRINRPDPPTTRGVHACGIYRAMLAAAPQPKEPK